MKNNYCHISVVLDRSGSMSSCVKETREGFNKFISDQQKNSGETTVSLAQFDDKYEVNYQFKPIKEVPFLDTNNFIPRGMTALLDAMGKTINETGKQLADLNEKERPSRVIMVILTDGEENSSREFTRQQVFDMVKHQQDKYNWDFVFLGANQDAIATASQYGIGAKSAMNYVGSNSVQAFAAASNYTSSFRSAPSVAASKLCAFSDEERDEAMNTGGTTAGNSTVVPSVSKTQINKAKIKKLSSTSAK